MLDLRLRDTRRTCDYLPTFDSNARGSKSKDEV
ncbi:hypothetical protein RSAG8_10469, partial [Rhizoctonia solani AG-8 WAC10335]